MNGLLQALPAEQRELVGAARPGTELAARPMLATLSDRRDFPGGGKWIFERKLDGVRVLAVREGDRVVLLSRSGHRLNATYPEVVDALAAKGPDSTSRWRCPRDGLRLRCSWGREFVMGGSPDRAGGGVGPGPLLLGYQEAGRLPSAGRGGTGFARRALLALRARLDELT